MTQLELRVLADLYALALLPAESGLPPLTSVSEFSAAIRSPQGTTICCAERALPVSVEAKRGFRCLEIVGPFDLESTGVVASATRPLAANGISVFVFSTWENDFILVGNDELSDAITALEAAGHTVRGTS